ncbi:P-loop NTPase [Bradyrhizobium sp. McL0616]|uniref:P-loop NTPase n=1 Tax=Bradyrhizobium sp. McL0616 TaxID=3415674 RepID=UPI003CF6B3ED
MLEAGHSKFVTTSEEFPAAIPPREVIASALALVRRNRGTILACLAITSVASIVYLLTATPRFTAKAALYIDAPKVRVMEPERPIEGTIDSTTIESQVEILQSDAIAAAVVTKQGLAEDAGFLAEGRSVVGSVLGFLNEALSSPTTRSALSPIQRAMRVVQSNLSVARSGVSAVIRVDYGDSDPERAARIANAVAEAYVDSRIDARRKIAERASAWLRTNLKELQQKAAAAESELQEFRAKNDISAQAKFSDLQATANTYRKLYDSSLQRYAETVQQESLQLADADVVSAALPPPVKSHPKPSLVLPIGLFAGLCLGLGFALWRELSDQTFRTTEQVRDNLKMDCLAVPETIATSYSQRRSALSSFFGRGSPQNIRSIGIFAHVLLSPVSQFAESLRALKVNCDCQMTQGKSKILGVTSALEKEGKSTIASNFALLLSRAGRTTLLVDADFHTSALSRVLAPDATEGFCEAVLGRAQPDEVIRRYSNCGLHFLPGVPQPQPFEASEFLGSEASRAFLEKLRQQYDYIVVDLPPLAPVVDVRAGSAILDGLILVVQWGKTPIPTVQRTLESSQSMQCKLLGVVLNNVDLRTMRRYGYRQQESEFYGSRASMA